MISLPCLMLNWQYTSSLQKENSVNLNYCLSMLILIKFLYFYK